MPNDFKIKNGVLYECRGSDSEVIIPNSVTLIRDFAFLNSASQIDLFAV